MYLDTVTITGIDDSVDRNDLYNLSDEYSFVEWGMLYYEEKMNRPRFPSWYWMTQFIHHKPKYVKCSAHLCGKHITETFLNCDKWNKTYSEFISDFNRIQLNLRTDNTPSQFNHVSNAINYLNKLHPDIQIITQYREDNAYLIDDLTTKFLQGRLPKLNFLYDESGGNGVETWNYWMHPVDYAYCGYAGGISPDNIDNVMSKLFDIVPEDTHIWIDMESGVRTEDQFDLEKVEYILDTIYGYKYEYD